MPGCSPLQLAKRALVKVLLTLATKYGVALQVTRDSEDKVLLSAYKRVALKAHPDKGGTNRDFQKLQAAKEKWEQERAQSAPPGRPWPPTGAGGLVASTEESDELDKGYRVRCAAVLLTYSGVWCHALWRKFLEFVRAQLKPWSVWRWCATWERSDAGRLHVHLQLQFRKQVDHLAQYFVWEGRCPNASVNNLCGEGLCKGTRRQQSIDRAFFYVWADKEGTQRDPAGKECVEGNYAPVWSTAPMRYQVLGKWPETLWKQRKLSHAKYEEYLWETRDGVLPRKRNLDAVREHAEEVAEEREREATTKRVRENTFEKFPEVPEVTAWLALFQEEVDRYPFLLLLAPSRTRKTEFAKSLFRNPLQLEVGTLTHFPSGMEDFKRNTHDAIILDDVRDMLFLQMHQEKLQSKTDKRVEFASTPGGHLAYKRWLHRVPVVVTANFSTRNLELLETDDFLGHPDNRVLVKRQTAFAADRTQ